MRVSFGVNSFIWTENFGLNDLHLFSKAKDMGFDTFDLSISNPKGFPVKEVKRAADSSGIDLVVTNVLGLDANPISEDEKIREKAARVLKGLVDITLELGANILTGVNYASLGYITGKPRTQTEWKRSVETLQEVGEYALLQGDITIAFEPINRFETHFLNIASDAVNYCKDIGTGNMGVHLDTYHMIREETSFKEAIEHCGSTYLKHIHMCENNRGIPGSGLVPWKELMMALDLIDYQGALSIESFNPDFTEINRICAIWRKYADSGEELAEKGLAFIKTIVNATNNKP